MPALAQFPRGPEVGDLIHRVLERFDFQGSSEELERLCIAELTRAGREHQTLAPLLCGALLDFLQADLVLGDCSFSLRDVAVERRLSELAFVFPVVRREAPLSARRLASALGGDWVSEVYRKSVAELSFQPLAGYLRGFIDLVVEHEGRFFVVDYKTNFLGTSFADYAPEKLLEPMQQHHYLLQYHLYALGLHRYLKQRLRNYQPQQHWGGVAYLFIRGISFREQVALGGLFRCRERGALKRFGGGCRSRWREVLTVFDALHRSELFEAIDIELARSLSRRSNEQRTPILLSVALLSRMVRRGHVCMTLSDIREQATMELSSLWGSETMPEVADLRRLLEGSPLAGDGSKVTPLVLQAPSSLYFHAQYRHELRVAELLLHRAKLPWLYHRVSVPPLPDQLAGEQQLAVLVAFLRGTLVLSGGPGTGKTTTVAALLHWLSESQADHNMPYSALLLAPTGKASARLAEAVEGALFHQRGHRLECEAMTIHRALGQLPRRGVLGPASLSANCIVVDEASMIDLAMMRRLLEVVSDHSRLVILGDPLQLASIDAGAVLGDICLGAAGRGHSERLRQELTALCGFELATTDQGATPLSDCMVRLRSSRRFGDASGVGLLARACEGGDADGFINVLGNHPDLEWFPSDVGAEPFKRRVRDGYRDTLSAGEPKLALRALRRFRVLAAHRRGPYGIIQLNRTIQEQLVDAGLLPEAARQQTNFSRRPVIVRRNDHELRLTNGDVGVLFRDDGDRLRVFFEGYEGPPLVPNRLPEHETVFAMSVHKSQGSEFDEVVLVLPEETSPLLSRELLYTAVTRARRKLVVFASEGALRVAVRRRISRRSSLAERLWGPGVS